MTPVHIIIGVFILIILMLLFWPAHQDIMPEEQELIQHTVKRSMAVIGKL